jgi:ribosomal protein L11 methyltransferase
MTGTTWGWRRWIALRRREEWAEQMEAAGIATAIFIEKPNRQRIALEVFSEKRADILKLQKQFGGQVRSISAKQWLRPAKSAPVRIGRKLEVHHDKPKTRPRVPHLLIPHGIAFGSGDHGTTHMLLRALTRRAGWEKTSVLDLGTGSGVLALAARLFGARKIVATDFDPDAVRTARENETLNFPEPLVRWQRADVKRLRARPVYDLVLANIFSAILCEAAPRIAGSVAQGGELWLSGILREQRDEVMAAYRRQGMKLTRAVSRGKWVLLQFSKSSE